MVKAILPSRKGKRLQALAFSVDHLWTTGIQKSAINDNNTIPIKYIHNFI
jgi:hypothetical protein